MDDKVLIAKRVARELTDGSLVNLASACLRWFPDIYRPNRSLFPIRNGIIGMAPVPGAGMEALAHRRRGGFVGAIPRCEH